METGTLFVCRWWKPWTNPTSTSSQGERASTRRPTRIWCACRTMMGTTRHRPSASTTSPGRVSGRRAGAVLSCAPCCCFAICATRSGTWLCEPVRSGFVCVSLCFSYTLRENNPERAALWDRHATQRTVTHCSICPSPPRCFLPLAESTISAVRGHSVQCMSCVQATSHFSRSVVLFQVCLRSVLAIS